MITEGKYINEVADYCSDVISGKKLAGKEVIMACQRFVNDIKSDKWDFVPTDADNVIDLLELIFVHVKGEDLNGESLVGKPFRFQTYQKFIIYNLLGFFVKGSKIRR